MDSPESLWIGLADDLGRFFFSHQPGSRRCGPAVGGLHEHFPGANWTREDRSDEGGQAGRRGLAWRSGKGSRPGEESAFQQVKERFEPQLVALAVVSGPFPLRQMVFFVKVRHNFCTFEYSPIN